MHWEQPLPHCLGTHFLQSLALSRASSRVAGSSWLALALLELAFGFAGAFCSGAGARGGLVLWLLGDPAPLVRPGPEAAALGPQAAQGILVLFSG